MELEFGSTLPTTSSEIAEERWVRAKEEIDIRELVLDLTGARMKGQAISCPFGHGVGATDGRPSFYIYPNSNHCHCFGCPPGNNHFDTIGFVAQFLELPPFRALQWLEKRYDLPPIADTFTPVEEESQQGWLITPEEIRDSYFKAVQRSLKESPSVENARDFIQIYWESMDTQDPTYMAQVVGKTEIARLIRRLNGRR